ncbi:MAG: ABC transporter ATP-binding protein [Clostridiales bacterium]|nr:ABC transporter ATP-binding protein [Clostridiales bacterium]
MFKRLYHLLRDLGVHRLFIGSLLLRAPFDFLSTVLAANLISRFIRVMELGQESALLPTFALFLGLTFLLFLYNMTIWATISLKLNILLQKRIRKKMLHNILGAEYEDVQCYSSGEWINRLNYDADRLYFYMLGPVNFMHMFIAMVNIILSSIILAFLNLPLLIVSIIITVPFTFLSCIVVVRKVPVFKKRAQEKFGEYTNWAEPVIRAKDAISVFGGEELVLKKVEETSLAMLSQNMKAHRATARAGLLNTLCGASVYVILLVLGGAMMGEAVESLAALLKITQYRGGVMRGVMIVNSAVNNMKQNRAGAERALDVLESSHSQSTSLSI